MSRQTLFFAAAVVAVVAVAAAGYIFVVAGGGRGAPSGDTYLASCVVTGVGGFEFRVLSATTGEPVQGANVTAVDTLGCNSENQVVHIEAFSPAPGGGGWMIPAFPAEATPAGVLTFTVTYGGSTYHFSADIPQVGTDCATFEVPTGATTTTDVMNGNGSSCG